MFEGLDAELTKLLKNTITVLASNHICEDLRPRKLYAVIASGLKKYYVWYLIANLLFINASNDLHLKRVNAGVMLIVLSKACDYVDNYCYL